MVLWSSQKLKTRLVARVSLPCEYNSIDKSTSKKQSMSQKTALGGGGGGG